MATENTVDESGRFTSAIAGGACLFLIGLSFVLYARGLGYPFVRDDFPIVVRNPIVVTPGQLGEIWSSGYWPETTGKVDPLYRPLGISTFHLQHQIFGSESTGYHLFNTLLHGLVCVFLFLLIRDLSGRIDIGFTCAVLFCCHAVNVEAVQYVVGRLDLLAAFGFVAALFFHQKARSRAGWGAFLCRAGAGLACGIAVFSKENGVMVFPAVVLLDLWIVRYRSGKSGGSQTRRIPYFSYLSYGGVFLGYLALRWFVFDGDMSRSAEEVALLDNPLAGVSFGARCLGGLVLLQKALLLMLLPWSVSSDYSLAAIPVPETPGSPGVLIGVGFLVLLVWGGMRSFRGRGLVLLGVGWFVLSFAIPSQVLLPIGTIFGLRLLYLPCAGFCLLLGSGLAFVGEKLFSGNRRSWVLASLSGAVCLYFCVASFAQIGMWKDEETLVFRSLAAEPESARLNYLAGGMLARAGKETEALAHLQKAVEIFPDLDSARAMLAMVLVRRGDLDQGLTEIDRAFESSPEIVIPSFVFLGELLLKKGRVKEAEKYLSVYVQRNSGSTKAKGLLKRARALMKSSG